MKCNLQLGPSELFTDYGSIQRKWTIVQCSTLIVHHVHNVTMYTSALIKWCPIPQSYPRPDMYWSKNSFQRHWRVALKKSTLLSALSASLSRRIFEYCLFGLKNSTLLSALPLYLDEGSLHPTFSLIHPHNTIQAQIVSTLSIPSQEWWKWW